MKNTKCVILAAVVMLCAAFGAQQTLRAQSVQPENFFYVNDVGGDQWAPSIAAVGLPNPRQDAVSTI